MSVLRTGRIAALALLAAGALTAGSIAVGPAAIARPNAAPAHAPAANTVAAGTNLLLNSRGTAGDTSAQGWDAVTIPGWQVAAGLPTVVRYGTAGFPKTTGKWLAKWGR